MPSRAAAPKILQIPIPVKTISVFRHLPEFLHALGRDPETIVSPLTVKPSNLIAVHE
jgi:hypothetical protein